MTEEEKSLSEQIAEELRERQKEMEACNHEEIERNKDRNDVEEHKWHCKECGMAFSPHKSDIDLPDIEQYGNFTRIRISSK